MVNFRRFKIKDKIIEIAGGKCCVCGYNKSKEALTFHHLDPSSKQFEISGSHSKSMASILKEVEKCAMLCFNCHMEVHSGIIRLSDFLKDSSKKIVDYDVNKCKKYYLDNV